MPGNPPEDIPDADPFRDDGAGDPVEAPNPDRARTIGSHRRSGAERKWTRWVTWFATLMALGVGVTVALAQLTRPVAPANRTSPSTVPSTVSTTTIPSITAPFAVAIEVTGDTDDSVGLGAGIVIGDGTYILTNAHVVDGAMTMRVIDGEAMRHDGTLIGIDPVTNLAVIRVDDPLDSMPAASLVPLSIGSILTPAYSNDPATVIATRQRITVGDTWRLYDLIEMDRNYPRDKTGSPLFDEGGQVAAMAMVTSDDDGPGYAIAIATALSVADELIHSGEVAHGYLGLQGIDSLLGGIEVFAFPAGSALRAAGAREGDIIVALDDTPLVDTSELVALLRTYRAGDNVTVSVMREFETIALELTLDRHPDS